MGKEEDIMKAKQLKILGTFVMVTMIHGTPVLAGGGDTGIEIHGQQTGNNVSLGSGSLASNENNPAKSTGVGNTAIGFEALYKNTHGQHNTAIAVHATAANKSGGSNVCIDAPPAPPSHTIYIKPHTPPYTTNW